MINTANEPSRWRRFVQTTILLAAIFGRPALAEQLDGDALRQSLANVIERHPATKRSSICLKVIDLETDEVLFDRRGNQLMTPASNLKIYSGACALEQFGPEHRIQTGVHLEGTLKGEVLNGDIVIVGGGDPMYTSAELKRMAIQLEDRFKLKSVMGNVRVDNSRYSSPLKGPGWMWDDEPYYFNMSITPMMVDFNVLQVNVDPGSNTAELALPSTYPSVVVDTDNSSEELRVTRLPFSETITVTGLSNTDAASSHRLTMHDPGLWVAGMFKEMLRSLGVDFQPPTMPYLPNSPDQTEHPNDSKSRAVVILGQTFRETLNHFQEESENAIGEILLHEIAIAQGTLQPAWTEGASAISDWLVETAGLERGSFRLVDGSGLSRYNLISADSSVRLLNYMHTSKYAKEFVESLPVYEIESEPGSQLTPDSQTLKNRVYAKGGSMSGVSTCSGYVRTLEDRWAGFFVLNERVCGAERSRKKN